MEAAARVNGRRLPDGFHYFDSEPGDYWKQLRGTTDDHGDPNGTPGVDYDWCIRDPRGQLGTITRHDITEHEDGTISVSPSILDATPGEEPGWHGYLERGVWREV